MQITEKKTYQKKSGFTLVELLLYIALSAIFLSAIVQFSWGAITAWARGSVQQEVYYTVQSAAERIAFEIRNATGISSVAVNSITLTSSVTQRNPTVIDLSSGRIRIGYGSTGDCPTSSPCFLTPANITISELTFSTITNSVSSQNIRFVLTGLKDNARDDWDATATATASAEVRGN